MNIQEMNTKSRILSKLLIPEGSYHFKSKNNSLVSHQSSNHNLQINNEESGQTRQSKSRSLYNVKDFLPTDFSDSNGQTQHQRTNKLQSQHVVQNNSKIFFLKTVSDNLEQSYLKDKAIQNQSFVEQLKKKDFKIDDLEAQVKKLKFDKLQAQKRYQAAQSSKQKVQKQYSKIRQQLQTLKDVMKQCRDQLTNLKKKQENKKRQIKFWSRKLHVDIQPKNIQKYSISSQTESRTYNNHIGNDNKISLFSINPTKYGYSNQQSQRVSYQATQNNFYNHKNRDGQQYYHRRLSECQKSQKLKLDNRQTNLKTNRVLNKQPLMSNFDKQNQEKRSNFNIPLPSWQIKLTEQKSWKNKVKDEAIQIYPVNQRQVQNIIKSLLQ